AYGHSLNRSKVTSMCCVLAAALIGAQPVAAQEVIAAWEGNSFSGNAILGGAFGIPLSNTSAIMIRPTASYLYYDIRQLGVVSTHVPAPAISLGLGYRYADSKLTFDIGPSLQVLWEQRKAVGGLGGSTDKTHFGAGVASALSYQFTPLTSFNIA